MSSQAFVVSIELDPTASLDGISEEITEVLSDAGLHVLHVNPWNKPHDLTQLDEPDVIELGNTMSPKSTKPLF